jgi:hypothetical protein
MCPGGTGTPASNLTGLKTPLTIPEHTIATVIGLTVLQSPEAQAHRGILVGLAHTNAELEFDEADVDGLGAMGICALERLFEGVMGERCTDQMLREPLGPAGGKRVP